MAIVGKQLGQLRPADTNAASLYSPPASTAARLTQLFVCNQTAGGETFRVFCDDDGTTYDQTTALYYDVAIAANVTSKIDLALYMNDASGNLAIRSSTASALTFTMFGIETS